jgi:hypothetical protein
MAPLLLCLTVLAAPAAPPERIPYVQTFDNGSTVDWLDGKASTVGRVRIFRDLRGNPVTYKVTQKEAEDDGYTRLMNALGDAAMDAGSRLSTQPEILQRYRRLIEKTPATEVLQDRGSTFRVRLVAPLKGESGLMSVLLPDRKPDEEEAGVTTAVWRGAGGAHGTGARHARRTLPATGLVIDARHLTGDRLPAPAFLPRVLDSDGRVVYGVDSVDLDFARAYGLAVYQAPSREGAPEPEPGREGSDPIQVMATGARGELRADIEIEPQAADRILKAAEDAPFLKECRVLVLMPPSPRPPAVEPPHRRRPAPGTQPPPGDPR